MYDILKFLSPMISHDAMFWSMLPNPYALLILQIDVNMKKKKSRGCAVLLLADHQTYIHFDVSIPWLSSRLLVVIYEVVSVFSCILYSSVYTISSADNISLRESLDCRVNKTPTPNQFEFPKRRQVVNIHRNYNGEVNPTTLTGIYSNLWSSNTKHLLYEGAT